MLDKLPPELLRLVGKAACPREHIEEDVIVHGAALDASGHLVQTPDNPRRPNLGARQILVQMHARLAHTQNTVTVVKGYYYLDGERVHINVLRMSNTRLDPVDRWGVPGQRFGMITYDTSYSWRNATISYE